jgi:hypothetical protein
MQKVQETNLSLRGKVPKSDPMFSWKFSRCARQGFLEGETQKYHKFLVSCCTSSVYTRNSTRHAPASIWRIARGFTSLPPCGVRECAISLANAIKTMVFRYPPRPQNPHGTLSNPLEH